MTKFIINHKIKFLFLLISFFWLIAILGIENISFQSTQWLHNGSDQGLHHLGWYFFKNDIWRFPLGNNPTYGDGFGSSIVFTDSIPIFALIFKSLKFMLPENFQYFSLWYFISLYLQLFFSFKILKKFTNSEIYSFIGSLFFIICPFFMFRVGWHAAVSAHWILLCTLYLALTYKVNESKLSWFILIILTPLISYSFTAITVVFYALLRLFNFFYYRKDFLVILKDFFIISIFLLLIAYIVGYFEVRMVDTLARGFGVYKLNLLSIFDSGMMEAKYSWLLPDINLLRGEELDGFNFIGLGGILMFLIISTLSLKKNYRKKIFYNENSRNIKIIFLISIFFTLWALTNKISFGSFTILEIPLNKYFLALFSVIVNTGRLFWIVNYFILILLIITIFKCFEKKNSLKIITLLFIIQLADSSVVINSRIGLIKPFNKTVVMNDSIWGVLLEKRKVLKTTYPISWSPLFSSFSYLMEKNNIIKTNLVIQARNNRKAMAEARYVLYDDLRKKKLDSNTLYVIDNLGHLRQLKYLYKNEDVGFFYRDNFWSMAVNEKKLMQDNDVRKFNEITFKVLEIDKKKSLSFKEKDNFYGFGWSHNLNKSGIWSEGPKSTLMFKIDENYGDIKLEIFCSPYISEKNESLEFDIYVNNLLNKKMKLTKSNLEESFVIIIKKDLIINNELKVDFSFKNPISPFELLKSPDSRKLGILLKNIKISRDLT